MPSSSPASTCASDTGRGSGAFDFDRPGHFETWLRAVALNLCRDARRQRTGRFRPFAALKRLPPLEQRIFRLRHEMGLSFDQTFASLAPEFPGLTESRLSEADAAVTVQVSARQRWTLLTRRPRLETIDSSRDGDPVGCAAHDCWDQSPSTNDKCDPWRTLLPNIASRLLVY